MSNNNGNTDDMKTLSSCMRMLERQGFTTQFVTEGEQSLKSLSSEKSFSPEQVTILNFYRFEGSSNPEDNAILYAIEAEGGERGLLTNAYGVYADDTAETFLRAVESIKKKTDRDAPLG